MDPPAPPPNAPIELPPDWLIGLTVGVISAFSAASSMLLLKASADREKGRPLWRKPIWFCGFALLLLNGLLLDPAAISLAPLALLLPLGGLTMIFSLLLARCLMRELLGRAGFLCVAVIITGMMIISYCGPHLDRVPTLLQLHRLGMTPQAIIMGSAAIAFVISDLLLVNVKALQRYRPPADSLRWSLYSALAARSCGAFVWVGLKVVGTGVRSSIEEHSLESIWTTMPIFPIALICVFAGAPLQLYLLNASLGAAPASYAIPVYQSMGTIISATISGVVFREFKDHPVAMTGAFVVGVLVSISGVALLSYVQGKKDKKLKATRQQAPVALEMSTPQKEKSSPPPGCEASPTGESSLGDRRSTTKTWRGHQRLHDEHGEAPSPG